MHHDREVPNPERETTLILWTEAAEAHVKVYFRNLGTCVSLLLNPLRRVFR